MPCKPTTAAKPQAETSLTPARSFRDDNFLYELFKGAPAARQRRASARAGIVSRRRGVPGVGVRPGGGDHQGQGLMTATTAVVSALTQP